MTQPLSISLDADILVLLKKKKIETGIPVSQIVNRILREQLTKK